jgi:8-oxo-dGTP pyrophosphatase MutT (NUDIX family)
VDFDPTRPPSQPRDAATVVLLRDGPGGAEVFLLRRHRGASFMARSYVFPGGGREGEEDPRRTAARELFEEAGVLLADRPLPNGDLARWRAEQAAGAPLGEVMGEASLDLELLVPFSHWITPSAEKRRFSARFYVAVLPEGQVPSFDDVETVDEAWVTPRGGLRRADELLLPPPQLRTLRELAGPAPEGAAAVLAFARARAEHMLPIVPRFAPMSDQPEGFALLLPWDPDYETLGTGEGEAFPLGHPFGGGASRFVRQGNAWRDVEA